MHCKKEKDRERDVRHDNLKCETEAREIHVRHENLKCETQAREIM